MARPDEGFSVSAKQWEALALVVERAAANKPTYVAKSPHGDAAIPRSTARALVRRGFINVAAGEHCHPTPGGRLALETHLRHERRAADAGSDT